MIVLNNVHDVNILVEDQRLSDWIFNLNDQLAEDIEDGEDIPFETYFGGPIKIVETDEDLKEILLPASWVGKDINITEDAAVFDIAEYICEGRYAQIVLITNNSGGTTYIIPRVIVRSTPSVRRSIEITQEASEKVKKLSSNVNANNIPEVDEQ